MPRDTRSAFLRELDNVMPGMATAFQEAMQDVRSKSQFSLIQAAIDEGDVEAVIRLLQIDAAIFAPLDRVIEGAFYTGGAYALASLPKKPLQTGSLGPLVIRFQGRHPRAETWIRNRSSMLIREISNTQRTVIRETIEAGLKANRNPRSVALDLVGRMQGNQRTGGVVGLTRRQMRAVLRKREEMIAQGVSRITVENETRTAMNRALLRRGETIARTEMIAALNAGRYEGMQQLVDSGRVSADQIVVKWSSTMDSRTRDTHRGMNGNVVPFGQPFITPSGALLRFPGDTAFGAPASETINCRCFAGIEIDFLAAAA